MNSFANNLFTLLFGWARTIIQQLWSTSTSGHFSGFFSWLGDNWLWLVAALALAGTVIDLAVWLLRWQPYLVWKTRMRRLGCWLRGDRSAPPRRFEKGYQAGVALDIQQDEAPEAPPAEEWQDPIWNLPQESAQEDGSHTFTEILMRDGQLSDTALERQGRSSASAAQYEPPALVTASWLSGAYRKAHSAPPAPRKRRSKKNDRKKPTWAAKLMIPEVEEDLLLDGLPPAVDRQQAFHEPVYPMKDYTGADTGWQPPASGPSAEGNYRR